MRRRTVRAAATAAILLVAGCGLGDPSPGGQARDDGPAPAAGMVSCGSTLYDPAELADAPSVSALPVGPAGAVDDAGDPAFDPAHDWRVVYESDDRVDLVRELDEPVDHGAGDVRTHEVRTVERITGATNVPEGTWMLMAAGPCAQRLVTADDLGEADLTLPHQPAPHDTEVALLVHERACASGQSADGRIEVVDLVETAEQVRLHVGVHMLGGDQTCQGNPPTPFTVELAQPLGDRELVDVSVVPPRPLIIDDGTGLGG